MSEIYVEPIAGTEPAEAAPSRRSGSWRWPKRILALVVLLWIVAQGVSLAIQHTRLHRILTSQFETAIGRTVEVGSYHFGLWDGPVIEARSVIVGEDPRFGAEYFLRADSMTVHLRWRSLLSGRLEFGTISLSHPSLNLVRNSSEDWNLAEWLPHPSVQPRGFAGPIAPPPVTRFQRIEIEGGRINFKLVDEKLPFAFTDVTGTVEMSGAGRWRMNLQARPWRAAVVLQQAGVIQVSGEVGGTSSRLRPAAVHFTWTSASLPDVLRLARDNDFGVRGLLSVAVEARTDSDADGWTLRSRAQLLQVHRWDLALRPDNPSLNLTAQIAYRPSSPYIELTQARIEAPRSNISASGRIYWNRGPSEHKHPLAPPKLRFSSAEIDASDALAWARAFYPGISDDLSARGSAHIDLTFSAWPPRLAHADLLTEGVDFSGAALLRPAHVGRLQVRYTNGNENAQRHGFASIAPITVSWGSPGHSEGLLRLEDVTMPTRSRSVWRISGSTTQVRDLLAGASAVGWDVTHGWDIAGPFACDLQWQQGGGNHIAEAVRQLSGWMEFGKPTGASDGAVLRLPFVNFPIEQVKARVELKTGVRHAKLFSAQAFGTRWTGTFERRDPSAPWQFDLAADQLSSADLDRWLNPRWRESFFDRMLPFLNSRPETSGLPGDVQAIGHLVVGEFALARLLVSRLQADLALHSRRITIANADGRFYGGEVTGSFDANLQTVPSYHADLDFSHIDASALIAAVPSLAGLTAESAGGQISFAAQGASRSDLVSSLTCQGTARVTHPELLQLDLWKSLEGRSQSKGNTRFPAGSADFSCSRGKIEFRRLQLVGNNSAAAGSGTVDFKGALDLRFRFDSDSSAPSSSTSREFRFTGALAEPQVSWIPPSLPRRPR